MGVPVLDLFAGPGGWDVAARDLGMAPLGIEWDDAACATRQKAKHCTVQGDVSMLDPMDYAPIRGLIGSPPCQAWSMAGKGGGERDKELCVQAALDLAAGNDTRAELREQCEDPRSLLVVEPLRYALALEPEWIALEQVPPVIEMWSLFSQILGALDYNVWAGVLCAADYGVPQTRRRAILMASAYPVHPPEPSHCRGGGQTLFGDLVPWVTMAEALGWDEDDELEHPRGAGMKERHGERPNRPASEPSLVVTSKARSWTRDKPAPTLVTTRRSNEGIIVGRQLAPGEGQNVGGWGWERPSTTVCADPRIPPPGWRGSPEDYADGNPTRSGDDAIRVTTQEASILQSFPADYPWQGSRSKQFEQIGNAVPPGLARPILRELASDLQEARRAA